MVDASSIEMFLESLNAARNISRELLKLVRSGPARDKASEMDAEIIAANGFALTAQTHQFSLLKKVSELEEELSRLKDFRREKENYELKNIGDTAFVYAYKPTMESTKPIHWLCSACCDQDRKSILQSGARYTGRGGWSDIWKCPTCKAEFRVPTDTRP